MYKLLTIIFLLGSTVYANTPTFTVGTDPLLNIQNTGTALNLNDDAVSSMQNLGFDFTYYGNTYSQARVAMNGFVTFNPNFNIYNRLIEKEYFKFARREPIKVQFKCKWGNQSKSPQTATGWIIGYIISMEAIQPELADRNQIEFIVIDPPSWYLNVGDASGKCYTGNVGNVIRDVVQDYSPKGPNNQPFFETRYLNY